MKSMENERQNLHTRLLDAVRACQTHLGGRKEMVTEASSWVSCLCTQFEAVLQHQLKSTPKGGLSISTLKQAAVGPIFEEPPTFWQLVKHHLTKHEVERFESMSNITSDVGKGRAWIRSSLNEHSLDRYFLILLSDSALLRNLYELDAFMLDEEKTSTLPQMAAGLGSIYFNIKFNDSSLNRSLKPLQPQNTGFIPSLIGGSATIISKDEKVVNDAVLEAHCAEKPKKRTGKKKKANIISFGDDDEAGGSQGSVTPAEKGGPGFVVVKQALIKSSASVASDSSSGLISNDGQLHGCDQQKKLENNAAIPKMKSDTEKATIENVYSNRLANIHIHSGDAASDSSLKLPCQDMSSTNEASEASAIETPKNDDDATTDDLSHASRHLLTVRHPSALSSHDLVMDDWSVRSNSLAGTPVVETAPAELHPMQDCESTSSHSRSDGREHSTSSASLVLSLARKSPNDNWKKNTAEASLLDTKNKDLMNADELRQALVALMYRKDELSEANRSMRTLLDSEMEHSSALRSEIEKNQLDLKRQKEDMTTLQQQHIRENEVLRNQLKKYVRAVQALQRGDTDVEMPGDLPRMPNETSTNQMESEVYEQKLIEVAEMHGELMEFNERLHVRLQSALSLLHNMKTELVDLRGPMPNDDLISRIENDNISGTPDYSPPLSRALINIWIPSAFLKGKGANAHHVFQVYVRIGDEEWNVYRRYSQFHDLHLQLRKKYVILDTYGFPPKKVMGNKGKKFVEDRRKGLQLYLRLLMNTIVQNHVKLVAQPNKTTLTKLLPFFSETLDNSEVPNKKQKRTRQAEL